MKKTASKPGKVLAALLLLASVAWVATVRWVMATWAHLTLEQLIYQLNAPMTGTGSDIILQGVVNIGVPLLVCIVLLVLVFRRLRSRGAVLLCVGLALVCDAAAGVYAWDNLDAGEYIENQSQESTFIEDHYVDPQQTALTFPEQKRNLIYIYLESMETTFADEASGGGFAENTIPELTRLALDNECFAGDTGVLNGGYAMPGTTWTMGALFGQTSGLPLQLAFEDNGMNSQSSFFSGVTCLGDILAENGYRQVFLIGSDARFGGRQLYFQSHGGYEIQDYHYALTNGLIGEGDSGVWGYKDKALFANAKRTLTELAAGGQPFNLTMLTVDTHFEDGDPCELCPDTFGDNQYANVMACSSKQVAEFVQWIQQQDFYENTTVIITGDHPTMDSDFCNDVSADYDRRTYTAYLNAAAVSQGTARTFTTFDNFPTTLAAMGVEIDGNRLGLGTNLFSATPTLAEEYGLDTLQTELARKSLFMEGLSGSAAADYARYTQLAATQHDPAGTVNVRALDAAHGEVVIRDIPEQKLESVTVELTDADGDVYTAALHPGQLDKSDCYVAVYAIAENGTEECLSLQHGSLDEMK